MINFIMSDDTTWTAQRAKKGIDIMEKKLTYVAALSNILSIRNFLEQNVTDFDVTATLDRLTDLMNQTEKRNSAEKKPTKTQLANAEYGQMVLEVLRNADKPMTITEIMDADTTLGQLNNQKVSAVVRGLGDQVVKTIEKRKSYFSLA